MELSWRAKNEAEDARMQAGVEPKVSIALCAIALPIMAGRQGREWTTKRRELTHHEPWPWSHARLTLLLDTAA